MVFNRIEILSAGVEEGEKEIERNRWAVLHAESGPWLPAAREREISERNEIQLTILISVEAGSFKILPNKSSV